MDTSSLKALCGQASAQGGMELTELDRQIAAMIDAAAQGDLAGARRGLSLGVDVDAKGWAGHSAAMAAARAGELECLRLLIEAGADVNLRDDPSDDTAAQWAAKLEDPSCLALLLQAGADLSLGGECDEYGYASMAPALEAARRGHWRSLELCDRAALARKNTYGATVAMMAASADDDASGVECLKVLARHGVDWNERMDGGWTAVMVAVDAGNPGCLRFLASQGADLEIFCEGSPEKGLEAEGAVVHKAARLGAAEMLIALAELGADLERAIPGGLTARELALKGGAFDCVEAIDAWLEKRALEAQTPQAPRKAGLRM